LCSRVVSARAALVACSRDAAALLAPPLIGEALDEHAAVHVERNHFDGRVAAEVTVEIVVHPGRGPWRDRAEQCGAHGFLVERDGYGVEPVLDPPDPALEVSGLSGEQAEQDLRCTAFDPHGRPPREKTGACSSTSRKDFIGSPVGKRSLT